MFQNGCPLNSSTLDLCATVNHLKVNLVELGSHKQRTTCIVIKTKLIEKAYHVFHLTMLNALSEGSKFYPIIFKMAHISHVEVLPPQTWTKWINMTTNGSSRLPPNLSWTLPPMFDKEEGKVHLTKGVAEKQNPSPLKWLSPRVATEVATNRSTLHIKQMLARQKY